MGTNQSSLENIPLAAHIKAVFLVRVLTAIVIAEGILVFGLGISLATLFPLKEKVPVYVEFQSGGNNFVRIARAGEDLTNNQALVALMLRKYVMDRETVNKIDEKQRYAQVFSMSTEGTADTFRKLYGGKDALVHQPGRKREVIIERDTALDYGISQVAFRTIDTNESKSSQEPVVNKWVATIAYDFYPQLVNIDNKHLNPMGLFVTEYTLSRPRI